MIWLQPWQRGNQAPQSSDICIISPHLSCWALSEQLQHCLVYGAPSPSVLQGVSCIFWVLPRLFFFFFFFLVGSQEVQGALQWLQR